MATGELSVETLRGEVAKAQAALVTDQDKLDDIHALLHDALSQLLRSVRRIEFDQADQSKVVGNIKASVDDIWVQHELEHVKVPADSEVARAILNSPVLAAVLQGIIAAA